MTLVKKTNSLELFGISYDKCSACDRELTLDIAMYFRDCNHVYCLYCTEDNPNCLCHPNGILIRFTDDKRARQSFKLLCALKRNEDVSSDNDDDDSDDSGISDEDVVAEEENNDENLDEENMETESHDVLLVRLQVKSLARMLNLNIENSKTTFAAISRKYF